MDEKLPSGIEYKGLDTVFNEELKEYVKEYITAEIWRKEQIVKFFKSVMEIRPEGKDRIKSIYA